MTISKQMLHHLALLLLGVLLRPIYVHASFAYCVGIVSYPTKAVVGFQLWNDNGDMAAQYRTVYFASKTTMKNNGWTLNLKFTEVDSWDYATELGEISVSHNVYGHIGVVPYKTTCRDMRKDKPVIYYGCYENMPYSYCSINPIRQKEFCRTRLSLGSDGSECVSLEEQRLNSTV
ncbi:hypothetical protein BCR41DRAFT_348932, partial [Lobosporangium transversale]